MIQATAWVVACSVILGLGGCDQVFGLRELSTVDAAAGDTSGERDATQDGTSVACAFESSGTTLTTGSGPIAISIVDLDGVNGLDLVVADTGGVSLLINQGGSFAAGSSPPSVITAPIGLVAAELSGDAMPDIGLVTSAGDTQILVQDTPLSFSPNALPSMGGGIVAFTGGDITHDGLIDLIGVQTGGNSLRVLPSSTPGKFGAVESIPTLAPLAVIVEHVTLDLANDLLVLHADQLELLTDVGNGFVSPSVKFPLSGARALASARGASGLFVGVATATNIAVYEGQGGTLLALGPLTSADTRAIALADTNGDGHPDIIVARPNTLQIFEADGQGGFLIGPTRTIGVDPSAIAIGDLDNNGAPDIVVADRTEGNVTMFRCQ